VAENGVSGTLLPLLFFFVVVVVAVLVSFLHFVKKYFLQGLSFVLNQKVRTVM